MPFCPECRAEFRDGFTQCNNCHVDLVEQLEPEMELSEENIQRALNGQELILVSRGTLDVVKETRELLASRRIASIIVEEENTQKIPGLPKRVALAVSKKDIEKTAEILGSAFQHMLEEEGVAPNPNLDGEHCPACGMSLPETMEECPECGLFVGRG